MITRETRRDFGGGVMSIILLNVVVITVIIMIAVFLTLVAIGLIIGSLVRSAVAKKKNKKTMKVGLWIGIFMIVIPWILVAVLVVSAKVSDAKNNRWLPGREELAGAVVDEDAGFEVFVPDSDSDSIDVDAIKADSIHKFKKSLNLDDILDDGKGNEMSSDVENSNEDNN